jgi:hypothetical protein
MAGEPSNVVASECRPRVLEFETPHVESENGKANPQDIPSNINTTAIENGLATTQQLRELEISLTLIKEELRLTKELRNQPLILSRSEDTTHPGTNPPPPFSSK